MGLLLAFIRLKERPPLARWQAFGGPRKEQPPAFCFFFFFSGSQ